MCAEDAKLRNIFKTIDTKFIALLDHLPRREPAINVSGSSNPKVDSLSQNITNTPQISLNNIHNTVTQKVSEPKLNYKRKRSSEDDGREPRSTAV
jgi:hypothetical protein